MHEERRQRKKQSSSGKAEMKENSVKQRRGGRTVTDTQRGKWDSAGQAEGWNHTQD